MYNLSGTYELKLKGIIDIFRKHNALINVEK